MHIAHCTYYLYFRIFKKYRNTKFKNFEIEYLKIENLEIYVKTTYVENANFTIDKNLSKFLCYFKV